MAGHILAPKPERAERKEKCDKCEHRKGYFCSLCGCPIVSKTKLQGASCPAKKW